MVTDVIENSVITVIECMRQNLAESMTVDDMAAAALFSKFHFTRIFQRVTGISPGRFLGALRIQEAKRLLLTTSLTVTEITHLVGYSSVGTFSTRFKEAVGLAPSDFRRQGGFSTAVGVDRRPRYAADSAITLHGEVLPPATSPRIDMVFVGLFPDWIPQGSPVRYALLPGPGPYQFDGVPPGTWHVLAQALTPAAGGASSPPAPRVVGAHGPISVRPRTEPARVDLQLRAVRTTDPPALLALPQAQLLPGPGPERASERSREGL